MGTFRRGQANAPVRKAKRQEPGKRGQEWVGNVPVGDEWNVRGWPATGTECGSTMAGTRPDSAQNIDRMAA